MGTLFNQSARDSRSVSMSEVDGFLADAVALAKKHSLTVSEVIAARDVLERRRQNDLYTANGDAFDEQMAGFGELLQQLTAAVESLRPSDGER